MVLSILLWALLALVLVVLAVLALPVRLRLHAQSFPMGRIRLELGLLGGLVPWIAMADSSRPRKARPSAGAGAARPQKARTAKKRRRPGRGRAARMLRAGPALIGGVLGCVRVDRFHVDCTFGLGDPAETGQVFGALAPFVYGARWGRGAAPSVKLTPVFDRACLEGEADVTLAVTPIRLLGPVLRFGWASFRPGR